MVVVYMVLIWCCSRVPLPTHCGSVGRSVDRSVTPSVTPRMSGTSDALPIAAPAAAPAPAPAAAAAACTPSDASPVLERTLREELDDAAAPPSPADTRTRTGETGTGHSSVHGTSTPLKPAQRASGGSSNASTPHVQGGPRDAQPRARLVLDSGSEVDTDNMSVDQWLAQSRRTTGSSTAANAQQVVFFQQILDRIGPQAILLAKFNSSEWWKLAQVTKSVHQKAATSSYFMQVLAMIHGCIGRLCATGDIHKYFTEEQQRVYDRDSDQISYPSLLMGTPMLRIQLEMIRQSMRMGACMQCDAMWSVLLS